MKRVVLSLIAVAPAVVQLGLGGLLQPHKVQAAPSPSASGSAFMPSHHVTMGSRSLDPIIPLVPAVGKAEAGKAGLQYLLAQRTTNFHHASESQALNMKVLASRLNGVVVRPGETFSYYKVVGPYTEANGFHWGRAFQGNRIVPSMGGGVCQGASTLYSAVLRTDLQVLERHPHSLTVPYLPPGEDATVASTYLNFRFKNTYDKPVYIAATADIKKRLLTVALWGARPAVPVQVHHKVLEVYPVPTVQQKTNAIPRGQTRVLAPGQAGVKAHTWVTKTIAGQRITKDLGIDTYRASPRITEVGTGVSPRPT